MTRWPSNKGMRGSAGAPAGPFGKPGNKYNAKKSECRAGHVHDSRAEARRCNELQLMERAGVIVGLEQQPVFRFEIDGRPVMLSNGQQARLKADFAYIENGRKVVEDRKGVIVRDFPLRWALAQTMWPDIDWRVV